ncbi:type IX secretion system periplasmic lipoprotein PorW/SprE [Flavobacterium channae]|uniref:type IX secretion system periplasmic lipoprotein PorW/SprE n=1 Tax=Flavobacterium channae TaxID=2897181 RepID=UPI001E48C763|nr:gliding motility protein [Flavobacterium channae]UGS23548.1 gliding motility protein [Flavobacterium channae]
MKRSILKYSFTVGFIFILIACSVRKDKFINRNFHAVNTKYNVLYNGYLALDKGLEDLKTTYQDNFWEILPIERMPENEEAMLPGQTKNQNFERAEEKAVKAIQKHSMNIAGTEKNPQMDEAYLLLAKARYYDNRFIPSLEALNYILYKYPLSDRIYHAKVWREKVNIRLDNDDIAIKNLKRLLKDKKIEGQDLADANAMLAQAYMNVQVKDTAIAALKVAKEETKSNEEKARYTFILGQLYESLEYNDSAYAAFQEVIDMNRKSPRRYVIQAHAKQASQFDYAKGDTLVFTEKFNKLLEDRENRPYLDVLNHQMGIFYDKLGLNEKAKKYYNKSIKLLSQDKYLVSSNYRNLGEIFFREANYKTAGKYYDSTLLRLDDRTREYRKIKKKRDNLDDVIKYETIAQQNDSILKVVAMSDLDRKSYYENYITNLKIEDEKKAKIAAEKAEKEANIQASLNNNNNSDISPKGGKTLGKIDATDNNIKNASMLPPGMGVGTDNSNFYFYNPVAVDFGKKDFQNNWGKRSLKDNWRWSSDKGNINDFKDDNQKDTDALKDSTVVVENPKYDTGFYLKQIPTDKKLLDSLTKDRDFAYYQLGLIYKEKFKEYELAASRLEQLLKNKPEERLVLPAMYNLYKIYQQISPSKAAEMKQQILSQYPDSRYAQILNNPEVEIMDNDNPELVFNALFKKYNNNQIREVSTELDEAIFKFAGEESLPKFEMLKAKTIARLQGVEEYKKALNFVALTYPNALEGKEAEKMVQMEVPLIEALDFGLAQPTGYKIIFPKKYPYDKDVKNLTEKIAKYIKDTNAVALKTSEDIYTLTDNFIVIHGFDNKDAAISVLSVLQLHKNYKLTDKVYIISTEDYKIVQMKKKLEEWILLNK